MSLLPEISSFFTNSWMPEVTPLMTAISMNNVNNLGLNKNIINENPYLFNNELVNKNLPITNQRSSGRCWLFASCNLIRSVSYPTLTEKYGEIDGFELSQNYLFFWDKLERYHRTLRYYVDINTNKTDNLDRYNYQLLQDPMGDGGQWDMAKDIIKKYGLVPKSVYPDTHHSINTRNMNKVLTTQLKSDINELKKVLNEPCVNDMINTMVKKVFKILISYLGKPPDNFSWTFKTGKDKIVTEKSLTPLKFLEILNFKPDEWVSVINDPRKINKYNQYYKVKYLGNVFDNHVGWLNLDMDRLIDMTKKSIDAKTPVWFGCDMGAETDSKSGVKDIGIIDLDGILGTNIKMNKEEQLSTYSSLPSHAMMISGYHEDINKIVRWKVENSWGKDSGKEGYILMTNEWMKEYVYQILVKKELLLENELIIVNNSEEIYEKIEPWDPLGTLA